MAGWNWLCTQEMSTMLTLYSLHLCCSRCAAEASSVEELLVCVGGPMCGTLPLRGGLRI